MAQTTDTRFKTLVCGEALDVGQRIKLGTDPGLFASSGYSGDPIVADAAGMTDKSIGTATRKTFAAGEATSILLHLGGTSKVIAAGIIPCGAQIYAAGNGRVSASGTVPEGFALEEATAAGDIIEAILK